MLSDKNKIPEHGGILPKSGADLLDFSANLNPLGMPENVREALLRSAGDWERYPDPDCAELTELLAKRHGVSPENIVCGSGAADLIYRIIGAIHPKHGLVADPCFSEYGKAFRENGIPVTGLMLFEEIGFAVHENILNQVSNIRKGYMLVLASPNNPTGRVISGELLQRFCAECERIGVYFLCDECFLDLTENAASVLEFMNPNVIMLSAFTKTYALAGLRLGYAVFGDKRLAETVRRRGQYWSVSAPAQTAGIAALDSGDYLERSRTLIAEQRDFLTERISALGIKVFPSDANFLLIKSEVPLYKPLSERGIVIRRCGNFGYLNDKFYRIAVRTESENKKLIEAIAELFKKK